MSFQHTCQCERGLILQFFMIFSYLLLLCFFGRIVLDSSAFISALYDDFLSLLWFTRGSLFMRGGLYCPCMQGLTGWGIGCQGKGA